MEWTPVPVAEFLLFHLGSLARPAALLGGLAVAMAAGGLAGALRVALGCGRVRLTAGSLVAGAFLLVVFLLVFVPSSEATQVVFVCFLLAFLALSSLPRVPVTGRRRFIEQNLAVLGGAALLVSLFSVRPLLGVLAEKRFFAFRRPRGWHLSGLTELVTPIDSFYRMDKVLEYPRVGPPGWRLSVDGMVDRSLNLDYGAIVGSRPVHRFVTMECVDNPVGGALMSTALFTGVLLRDVLRAAGARGNTVALHGADDYVESLPRAVLEAHGALLTYAMNGESLRGVHGYPLRLLVPGVYGFKSVKWLTRLEILQAGTRDSWGDHGWTETAQIHTTTRIDVARRDADGIIVAGIAFAGIRGIRAVEIRVNGGAWRRATLRPALSSDAWVQWGIRLSGSARARIEARAIDGRGMIQTARAHGAYPNGSTGWATTEV